MKHKNLMAKALYDNAPESPEELSFRKGDILMVIEQNTGGLEGWWLCSLHGRQGIAPGNRLKLLVGPIYDSSTSEPSSSVATQQSLQQGIYQVPPSLHGHPSCGSSFRDPIYQVPPSQLSQNVYQVPPSASGQGAQGHEIYQVPPSVHRSPWGADSAPPTSKVRCGQGYSPARQQQRVYDIPPVRQQGLYDIPAAMLKGPMHQTQLEEFKAKGLYDIPSCLGKEKQSVYDIPPISCKEALGNHDREATYDFPPPMRHFTDPLISHKSEGLYDIPPTTVKPSLKLNSIHSGGGISSLKQSIYDVPPTVVNSELVSKKQCVYDIPPTHQQSPQKDIYDIPRGLQDFEQSASGVENTVYDVPPQVSQDVRAVQDVTDGMNRLSFSSTGSTRSNMSTSSTTSKESSVSASPLPEKKLLLDLDSAFERLTQLQQNVDTSVKGLMAFVNPNWRSYEIMEKNLNEIHACVDKVKHSLLGFLGFAQGALVNASRLSDISLHNKLKKQMQRLDDSYQILVQTSQALDNNNWSLNILVVNRSHNKCDNLDRFVMVTKTIPDDIKQLASSMSTNAELLFKQGVGITNLETVHEINQLTVGDKSTTSFNQPHSQGDKTMIQIRPLHSPPQLDREDHIKSTEIIDKSWMEDYDYVHLQGKDEFERQQRELLEKENIVKQNKMQLEQHQLNQFQELEKEITKPVENDLSNWKAPQHIPQKSSSLSSQDKQLLFFYSEQCETHFVTLLNAIDAFFSSISGGQPPRIFVAHSKFIILSAHKLVFIGDTLSRQAMAQDVRNKVLNYSNLLCELLKSIVMATKTAALQYPSIAAVQEMVDKVTELSYHSHQFKVLLLHLASL
ncbi:enhancer of filamentation 1 [Chiloscyllium plagiosum]|uniref:enhancer of filamentation 1 n=1 Tax=Chiloscyllium plagiosum TaxID=36176 RepID=UPI001CB83772|nr:enhancer of filamentation 1 [Chiloscyllium plagiosum]